MLNFACTHKDMRTCCSSKRVGAALALAAALAADSRVAPAVALDVSTALARALALAVDPALTRALALAVALAPAAWRAAMLAGTCAHARACLHSQAQLHSDHRCTWACTCGPARGLS
eukprot:12947013-Alexandrium_andersonii.AAC.1